MKNHYYNDDQSKSNVYSNLKNITFVLITSLLLSIILFKNAAAWDTQKTKNYHRISIFERNFHRSLVNVYEMAAPNVTTVR